MFILKFRLPILIAFVCLTAISLWRAQDIQFIYDFERFFPDGDEDVDFFNEFRTHFEPDDNFVLIGIQNEPSIYDSAFLAKAHLLTRACDSLEYVKASTSVTVERRFVKAQFLVTSYPVLNFEDPEKLARDSAWIAQDERYNGRMVSADGKTLCIIVKTLDSLRQPESALLIRQIDSLAADAGLEDIHLLGKAFFQKEIVELQQQEFIISTALSALLVALVFWLIFRRLAAVVIALLAVGISMSLFMGYVAISKTPLDLVSALYPVLMVIVGISDVVHVFSNYTDQLQKGYNRRQALNITIREIGVATLMTSLTTAIGFTTLLTSRIVPIRLFGITCAIGVMIAYITVILFVSAILAGVKVERIQRPRANLKWMKKWLLGFYYFTKQRPREILVGIAIVIGISAWGISSITDDTKVYNTIPRDSRIIADFEFFEKQFYGFRPFEIMVTAGDSMQVTDLAVLEQIDTIEQLLKTIPEIGAVNSVTTLYKSLNRGYWGDVQSYYKLPTTEKKLKKLESTFGSPIKGDVNILVSEDLRFARISGQIRDIGFEDIRLIQGKVDSFITTYTDPDIATFRQTGTGILVDKNNVYLRQSLITGLMIAFLAVSLLMALLFKNFKMVVISLVPNLLPLVVGAAAIGFLNIQFDAPTSIIFAISFGIAVDDTIHFLSKFKLELAKGRSTERALRHTFIETGQAILITTVILFVGFSILLFSKNPATFNAGLLISLTLFTALFADLLIIPVLVRAWKIK